MSIRRESGVVVLKLIKVLVWRRLVSQRLFLADLLQPLFLRQPYHLFDWVCRLGLTVLERYAVVNGFLTQLVCVKWVGSSIEQGLYCFGVVALHCEHERGHSCPCFHIYVYRLPIAFKHPVRPFPSLINLDQIVQHRSPKRVLCIDICIIFN